MNMDQANSKTDLSLIIRPKDILTVCIIILGFSLTLMTYFKDNETYLTSIKIIFWLIIIPFNLEAILAAVSNYNVKFRKIMDIALVLCLILLFFSLIILFSDITIPDFTLLSKHADIIGIVFVVFFFILLIVILMLGEKYEVDMKGKIFDKIYKITKQFTETKNYVTEIVVVYKSGTLSILVGEMCGLRFHDQPVLGPRLDGYGFRSYNHKTFFAKEINLIDENIILITDLPNLSQIVKKFEENKNKILGIIVDYKLTTSEKNKLKKYLIEELE